MKNAKVFLLFLVAAHISCLSAAKDKKVIHISDYGILPNTKENIQPVINRILKENKNTSSLDIHFEKGRYDFWPQPILEKSNKPTIAFDLDSLSNVTIDGGGSDFVFHGRMMPFRLYKTSNVSIRDFSIDWDRPYNSQAKILAASDTSVDMEIDRKVYPYEIINDTIYFLGEGWRSKITPEYTNLYDNATKNLIYQTRDKPMGMALYHAKVTELGENKIRFHFKPAMKPEAGSITVFFHGRYITDGILIMSSKDTYLENINIYHTLSCGVSGYRSENISLRKVNIINNESKDRAFSTVADATHFNGCKGHILFDGCSVSGAGDDFMNIHGMYSKVIGIINDHSVLVAPNGRFIGFDPDETAWALDSATMQRKYEFKVSDQKKKFDLQNDLTGYILTFQDKIKDKIKMGDLLENKDRNPSLTVRNCSMLKKNRGRSVLVTTAGDVLIENNYFNSAGAAILIEGDTDLWFESGGVRKVVIRHNIFEDCYSSGNNITDKPWGWGDGVISITPSVQPSGFGFPAYHKNIRIESNTFRHFDYAILYARAVDKLRFTKNKLYKTDTYKPFYRKANLFLDGCRNVVVKKNSFSNDFPGKNIKIINMQGSDIKQPGKTKLKVSSE